MGIDDYYKILKVNRDATYEELSESFNNLSLKWHPDKIKQYPLRKQEFETKFKKISEAYDVLSDPRKRQIYDKYGKYPMNFDGFNDGDGNNIKVDEDVGAVETEFYCTLEELYRGCRKKVKIIRTVPDGFGRTKCVEELLKISIKPGWKKGTKITFPGQGNERPGSPPSDLIFVVMETPHDTFKRDGNDLIMTQKISLLEALVGTTFNVTTLDGRDITVEVTDLVTPQYEKVVSDEGMPLAKEPSKKGKLRINFHVEYPSMLTALQKHDVRRILRDATYN
ncbi:DnaJ subfamily b member 1-like protein [Trifolium pratense]|uniref:DnaJ subfamily b member 1-like protein n=2 Tax=Trifolium pratense TaxID=57577 RepID=A0A2K3PNG0_TRIPR|nr:dnaJ homolog subfamily B member 13-like [Trifolium pratense]PNY16826.1 DnaJ subfamily b member 1-like protein [Trifolium pratense]CAJ2647823.1 unnamed protein product [Trifolium pratense]